MAATLVNGLCTASFRPLLRQPKAAGKLKRSWPSLSIPSVSLHGNGSSLKISSSLSTIDFIEQSKELVELDDDRSPPRWFSPLECGCRSTGSPLLLFLPGIGGSGLDLTLQYKKLGEIFDVWCLHVPAADRTPLADLVLLVQNTVKKEQDVSVKRPIYLVGESLGAALALLVAAKNPDIDFVLIMANPATNLIKALVQSVVPLLSMILNQLNAGFLHGMRSIAETVKWKLTMIQEMQKELNSHLHAVKAQTLILTSGIDILVTSITEGGKLGNVLQNSQTHTFRSNRDPLFSDDKLDLVATIKQTSYYRRGATVDYISDFLPPTPSELNSVLEPFRWMDVAVDPVMLSTKGGKIVRGLGGIPSEGPVLLVSNHMLQGLDITTVVSRFWEDENSIELRGIAHPGLFGRMKNKRLLDSPMLDLVRMLGAVPVSAKNLYRLLSLGHHVLLYPGGVREAFHRRGEEHKLFWPEDAEFVRMAARFGAKIVPFGVVGEDDLFQLLLDCDDQMKIPPLKAQMEALATEFVRLRTDVEGEVAKQILYYPIVRPKLPGRFYFFFGEPISTEGRKDVLTSKDKARELYLEVKRETEKCIDYLKERREKDPYRNLFARLVYQIFHGFDSQVLIFEI